MISPDMTGYQRSYKQLEPEHCYRVILPQKIYYMDILSTNGHQSPYHSHNKKKGSKPFHIIGAEGGIRTPMGFCPHDPESCASAYSATSAQQVYNKT